MVDGGDRGWGPALAAVLVAAATVAGCAQLAPGEDCGTRTADEIDEQLDASLDEGPWAGHEAVNATQPLAESWRCGAILGSVAGSEEAGAPEDASPQVDGRTWNWTLVYEDGNETLTLFLGEDASADTRRSGRPASTVDDRTVNVPTIDTDRAAQSLASAVDLDAYLDPPNTSVHYLVRANAPSDGWTVEVRLWTSTTVPGPTPPVSVGATDTLVEHRPGEGTDADRRTHRWTPNASLDTEVHHVNGSLGGDHTNMTANVSLEPGQRARVWASWNPDDLAASEAPSAPFRLEYARDGARWTPGDYARVVCGRDLAEGARAPGPAEGVQRALFGQDSDLEGPGDYQVRVSTCPSAAGEAPVDVTLTVLVRGPFQAPG